MRALVCNKNFTRCAKESCLLTKGPLNCLHHQTTGLLILVTIFEMTYKIKISVKEKQHLKSSVKNVTIRNRWCVGSHALSVRNVIPSKHLVISGGCYTLCVNFDGSKYQEIVNFLGIWYRLASSTLWWNDRKSWSISLQMHCDVICFDKFHFFEKKTDNSNFHLKLFVTWFFRSVHKFIRN